MTSLRFALRSLRKSPGFVAIAVLALGLGLGLSTTMFAVLETVTHPYVPFAGSERVYSVIDRYHYRRLGSLNSFDMFRYVRDGTTSFDLVQTAAVSVTTMETDLEAHDVFTGRVSPRYLASLELVPVAGRFFTEADAGTPVAVISEGLWRRLFSRRELRGLTITLAGQPHEVIGVMPRGMSLPLNARVWLPLSARAEATGAGLERARMFVRIREGVSVEQAEADLARLARRLTDLYQVRDSPFAFVLSSAREDPTRVGPLKKAMTGAALAVLLIACANLANLMLARGLARRREVALRLALGGPRAVVVRQLFAECVLVASAGALLGALLSLWGAWLLNHAVPMQIAWVGDLEPTFSWRVFALSAGTAIVASVVVGLIPAIRVVRGVSLDDPLREESSTTTGRVGGHNSLVVLELALALILLMAGGLLLRSVRLLKGFQHNYAARQLVEANVTLPQHADSARAAHNTLRTAIAQRVRTAPGVVDAAWTVTIWGPGAMISAERDSDSARTLVMGYDLVSPSYLATLGLPVLEGRDFNAGDELGEGAVILNARAAARLYPNGDAVGRMLLLGAPGRNAPWLRIVGIARTAGMMRGDARLLGGEAKVYVVRDAMPARARLVARLEREDAATTLALARVVRDVDPRMIGGRFAPHLAMDDAYAGGMRFLAAVFSVLGLAGLGLAAVGLYGVTSYAVSRRMREFGVRIAVGAAPRDLSRMVLRDGLTMILAGTGIGAFAALGAMPLLGGIVTVRPTDVVTLIVVELLLIAVSLAACLQPARRAARANPLDILRAS